MGGFLSIDGEIYGVTVAHAFEEVPEYSEGQKSLLSHEEPSFASGIAKKPTGVDPTGESSPHIVRHMTAGPIASLYRKRELQMSDVSKISDHPDYDWALCALHREQLDQTQMHLTNNVHLPNGNILYPKRIYLDDPKDGDVWVNTGNSGVVKGFVMGDYSLVALPGRRSFQRMWLVVLERYVGMARGLES